MEVNLGMAGAIRQSWSRDSIRQIFRELQEQHPKADHNRLVKLLSERLANEHAALIAACDYIVTNFLDSQEGYERRARQKTTLSPEEVARRRQQTNVAVASIKTQILLLNLPMANGKLARNCTGAELMAIGGGWSRIGKKIGKTKILGQVMNEEEVRKLMSGS